MQYSRRAGGVGGAGGSSRGAASVSLIVPQNPPPQRRPPQAPNRINERDGKRTIPECRAGDEWWVVGASVAVRREGGVVCVRRVSEAVAWKAPAGKDRPKCELSWQGELALLLLRFRRY